MIHTFMQTQGNNPQASPSRGHAAPAPSPSSSSQDPPLAKLIPHMKNAAARVFHADPQGNEYIRVTADNRAVNLLCRCVF